MLINRILFKHFKNLREYFLLLLVLVLRMSKNVHLELQRHFVHYAIYVVMSMKLIKILVLLREMMTKVEWLGS
jgi:hypothetical protein